ncbi:tripartite tricarboxylate transporter substrate binding protein [Aquabacterium sp. A08]|uniref:Bug family tripartite tricarboxylate transporter substrate binding protein n=1 Tax=Aquabacterium sp. A08 TaxID=2718532 RepID=UPI00141F3D5D|nr:tripartite tricarboxylate transporter substrate binding protein [Aquabacterium sp. A08]NIC43684.1 tripartite tricarboxylate transporter substrate binding protein [Aquabacterium sp. A08]
MTRTLPRRRTLGALSALALALGASLAAPLALAQSAYPTKPVRLVNNFPPGGPSDILARSVQPVLQALLKQPVIVENKAGAAGNIGAADVARAPADGHTVLFGIDTTFTVNPHIYKTMPFKPADFKPVVVMASSGLLVGVHPSTGIKTMKDLLAAGKGKGLNFSSAGNGSPGHLSVEVFKDAAGLKIHHIPYRGNTPAVTAVLAGEVDGGNLATPGMIPHVQAGKIIPLAVTSAQRSKLAPDLPTVGELGFKALEQEILYLVMVPSATPEPVVALLQKGIVDALKRPEVQQRLTSLDLHFEGLTGGAASKRLADMSARYAKVIEATGMTAE